jgi:hypothetical protein
VDIVRRFLGKSGTKVIKDVKTGKIIGEIIDDGKKVVRYPHGDWGTPKQHWKLEDKEKSTNVHVIIE